VMLAQPDVGAPRVARHHQTAHRGDLVDHLLRGQPDVGEVEAARDAVVDAEHQHVAVVGFDLRGPQDQHPVLVFERAVVGVPVELAMLREDDSIQRPLVPSELDPVEVGLYRCAAVLGCFAVTVKIKDSTQERLPHLAGRNFASVTSAVTSSYTTSTGMPILTCSGPQSIMLVSIFGPSSNWTYAIT